MAKMKTTPRAPDRGTKSARGWPRKVPIQTEEKDETSAARDGEKPKSSPDQEQQMPIDEVPATNS